MGETIFSHWHLLTISKVMHFKEKATTQKFNFLVY